VGDGGGGEAIGKVSLRVLKMLLSWDAHQEQQHLWNGTGLSL